MSAIDTLAHELERVCGLLDAERAANSRFRSLIQDVRCCAIEHVARSYVTVQIDRPTWEALHAVQGTP